MGCEVKDQNYNLWYFCTGSYLSNSLKEVKWHQNTKTGLKLSGSRCDGGTDPNWKFFASYLVSMYGGCQERGPTVKVCSHLKNTMETVMVWRWRACQLSDLHPPYYSICKISDLSFFQHKSGPKHLSKQRQHYWSSVGSSWLRTEQEAEESKVKLFPSRRKHSWRKKEGNVIYFLSIINQLSIIYQFISKEIFSPFFGKNQKMALSL